VREGAVLQQQEFLKRHTSKSGKPDSWLQGALDRLELDPKWLSKRLGMREKREARRASNRENNRELVLKTAALRRTMDGEKAVAAAETSEGRRRKDQRDSWKKPLNKGSKKSRPVRIFPPPQLEGSSSEDEDDEDEEDEVDGEYEFSEEYSSGEPDYGRDTLRRSQRLRNRPNGR